MINSSIYPYTSVVLLPPRAPNWPEEQHEAAWLRRSFRTQNHQCTPDAVMRSMVQ